MNSDIAYVPEFGVVKAKQVGELNNQTGMEIVQKATDIASKQKCGKILFDFTEMEVTAPILEIYHTPSLFIKMEIPHYFKLALVYSDDEESHKFWETVMRNSGFITRVFTEHSKALKWLTNQKSN